MWLGGGFSADLQVTTSYVVFYLGITWGNFPPIVSFPAPSTASQYMAYGVSIPRHPPLTPCVSVKGGHFERSL